MRRVPAATLVSVMLLAGSGSAQSLDRPSPAQAAPTDGVALFVRRLEPMLQRGDGAAFLALVSPSANPTRAAAFVSTEFVPGVAHAAVQERDREPLNATVGRGYRLIVDTFADFGTHARIATWRIDLVRTGAAGTDGEWAVADAERTSSVENIFRLSLSATKQYAAHQLKIAGEDLDLTLVDGSMFVAEIDGGVTALVLLGRGRMNFHPAPDTEKGQIKLFCGSDALDASFSSAFIRLNPGDFESLVPASEVQPVAVDPRELRRAQDLFRDESAKSFIIDLGDLSRDAWSLVPGAGDLVAEIRTRKYDTLTYAKSASEAEDITLFDRKRKHNVSLYASKAKLAQRGPFYNEDDLTDYDVLAYDVNVSVFPDRQWISGRAIMRVRIRAYGVATLTLRLADTLTVQSIGSREYGRLFGVRVKNQNMVIVSLPAFVPKDTQLTLTVNYAGRLEPQTADSEAVQTGQAMAESDLPQMVAEKSYLYSNRSYWYPQSPVSDYATAKIRVTVPATVDCVASGQLDPGFPLPLDPKDGEPARKIYVFTASRPVRYLALVLSRFARAETATIGFGTAALNVSIETNPRQSSRGHELTERTADIAQFYQSLIGDVPYPSFTLALVESDLPGGHSPAYFAELNQPLPNSPLVWRNDPAAFAGFPDFFLAHEVAHQWWGQAVGWRNYHEQWMSEGFAQYFAALYAQHQRGDEVFASVLRHMRRWAVDKSDQGPVYLGYRLGHIRNESRIFRALVYNKAALVLHMLRRLVGDEAFFNGLRRFYREERFKKAGTEDLRAAMEAESGQRLDRFFDRWIYGATLPKLRVAWNIDGTSLAVHVEQVGEIFDVPLTLSLLYADHKVDVVVPVTDRIVDRRIPIAENVRSVDVARDDGSLADVTVGKWPPLGPHPPARTAQTPE